MYSRILTPLDGSSLSEQVLPYVRQLAFGLAAPMTLITVVEPVTPTIGRSLNPEAYEYESETHLEDHAVSYLTGVVSGLREGRLDVSMVTSSGTPAQEIVAEAERVPGTLIAMSGHGRAGVARWWLGSVADRVLHLTTNPLLIVRSDEDNVSADVPGQERRFNRVVLPVDGSALAEEIIPFIVPVARELDLPVELVRVMPTWDEYLRQAAAPEFYNPAFESMAESMAAQVEEDANRYLEQLKTRLQQEGIGTVEVAPAPGRPGCLDNRRSQPRLLDRLVAMTTHGRSGVGRWVMGSVADRVVRNSGSPVLLLRSSGDRPAPYLRPAAA